MTRRISLLLLCFLLMTVTTMVGAPGAGHGTFTGTIINPDSRMVYVTYYRSHADQVLQIEAIDSTRTDAKGRYTLTIPIDRVTVFAIRSGEKYITYLKVIRPDDTVTADYTVEGEQTTIAVGGTAEVGNDFLFELEERLYKDSTVRAVHQASFGLGTEEFVKAIDSRRAYQLRLFETYADGKLIPSEIREYITSEINYRWGYDRLQYLWKIMRTRGISRGQLEVDESYFAPMRFLMTDSISPATGGSALYFIREYVHYAYETALQRSRTAGAPLDDHSRTSIMYEMIPSLLSGESRDIAIASILFEDEESTQRQADADSYRNASRYYGRTDSLVNEFASTASKSIYPDRLRQGIARSRRISSGQRAPEFTLQDIAGKAVSLSQLRGRTVYLEFWATSCSPCVAELPKTLELQKELAQENVVFVYISLNTDVPTWTKFIEKRKFTGIHLRASGANDSEVARAYQVTGIPRYFLIDKEGIVVTSDAPRPSGGAEKLIRAVVGKE